MLVCIIIVVAAGLDLQTLVIRGTAAIIGADATLALIDFCANYWFSLHSASLSFIGLMLLIIAARIYPYRIGWWRWWLVCIFCLARSHSLLWGRFTWLALYRLVKGDEPLSWWSIGDAATLTMCHAVAELPGALVLGIFTRSFRVAGVHVVTIAVTTLATVSFDAPQRLTLAIWHTMFVANVLAWAIFWRVRSIRPCCSHCGYLQDARGATRCSECGAPVDRRSGRESHASVDSTGSPPDGGAPTSSSC